LAVGLWRHVPGPSPPAPARQFALGPAPRQDQPVDILTAYRLAKALHSGVKPGLDWDRDGDGQVDQQDVNAWANDAVALQREAR